MGVCVYISNPFNRTRQMLSDVDLMENIAMFKSSITDTTGIQPNKQELIYMGECLEDEERSLQSYGVENNVTLFVYEKVELNQGGQDGEAKDEDVSMSVEELKGILSKARNPLYKNSVKHMVKNKESLRKAIKSSSLLKNDRITPALVEDSDLLLNIIETAPAEKIVGSYPGLCVVMKHIISNASLQSSAQQLFNDDDEDGELMGIDPAFLAQAEMMAANEQGDQGQSSSSSSAQQQQASRQAANQRHRISATDLANALSFATMTSTGTPTTPAGGGGGATNLSTATVEPAASENNEQTEVALQQMRAMGITDDELSRRALSMSGGVVEAALNLIFEGALN